MTIPLHAFLAAFGLLTLSATALSAEDSSRVNLIANPIFGNILERRENAYMEFWSVRPSFDLEGNTKIGKLTMGSNEEAPNFLEFEFTDKGNLVVSPRGKIATTPGRKYRLTWRVKGDDEAQMTAETLAVEYNAENKKSRHPAVKAQVTKEWTTQTLEWTARETGLEVTIQFTVASAVAGVSVILADPFLEEIAVAETNSAAPAEAAAPEAAAMP